MTPERFQALAAEGYNRIPVSCEVLADLDTPLSVYLKLVDGPFGYLFESVQGGEKWGRYSIIGLPCRTLLKVHGHQIRVERDGEADRGQRGRRSTGLHRGVPDSATGSPSVPDLPRFTGGLVGYFGYDTMRYIEPRLADCPNPDPLGTPGHPADGLGRGGGVRQPLRGRLYVIVHVDPSKGGSLRRRPQARLAGAGRRGCARRAAPS